MKRVLAVGAVAIAIGVAFVTIVDIQPDESGDYLVVSLMGHRVFEILL